jgi:peptidyl-tRNA hydrolase, PTH2 family
MIKQVIVLRKDLQIRLGKKIVQGSHAATMALMTALQTDKELVNEWLATGQTKICVSVDCVENLHLIYNFAIEDGLICSLVQDEGRTEFKGLPTYTAVCVFGDSEKVDKVTGSLPLL